MKILKNPLRVYSIIALAVAAIFFSCETLKDPATDYKIFALVTCDGSATGLYYNSMTVNYYVDKQYPFTDVKTDLTGQAQSSLTFPKKITTITITATKVNIDSTLNVLIYKNTSIVKYVNLPACSASTTSCSTTISISYDVNEKNPLTGATGTSTSSSSGSSTSSSTSSSSTSSTSSSGK
jgi:hypothetical protein